MANSSNQGTIAAIIGCVSGILGIFTIGIVFVPVAVVCTLVAFIAGVSKSNLGTIALSVLSGFFTVMGFIFSPSLWVVAGGLIGAAVLSDDESDAPASAQNEPLAVFAPGPVPTTPSTPTRLSDTGPQRDDLSLAFQAAFQSVGQAKVTDDGTEYSYEPKQLLWLGDTAVLVTEAKGCEAHVCAGRLSIHYLTRSRDGFDVEGAWPALVSTGTWGNPPTWKLRLDLTDEPVIQYESGGMWQGYACTWTGLVELGADNPAEIVETIATGYSYDDGKGNETEISGAIAPSVKGETFTVQYRGTQNVDVEYQRGDDGMFVKDLKSAKIPTC